MGFVSYNMKGIGKKSSSDLEVLLVHQVRRDSDSRAHPKKVEHDDNLRFNTKATWLKKPTTMCCHNLFGGMNLDFFWAKY